MNAKTHCEYCKEPLKDGFCENKTCPDFLFDKECLNCGAQLEAGWCSEHCQDGEEE